ncbi:MAG: SDR family NAD(P)-dependent oxidoreductase [Oricola sp.]|nr:SDR family NAD(P)-dependent oxidoreductase [Oricola sp.]
MGVLAGKTVLVTGASRGIGAAAAKAAAEAGARVLLHASAPSGAAETAASAAGGEVLFEDLSATGAGARLMSRAVAAAGRVDAVVNNAGIYIPSPLSGGDADWEEGWAQTLAVNVQAPADICRAAIAHFRERAAGLSSMWRAGPDIAATGPITPPMPRRRARSSP